MTPDFDRLAIALAVVNLVIGLAIGVIGCIAIWWIWF